MDGRTNTFEILAELKLRILYIEKFWFLSYMPKNALSQSSCRLPKLAISQEKTNKSTWFLFGMLISMKET